MKSEAMKKLLLAMEQQNIAELSDDTPHKFSKEFDKKALAVCRGEQGPSPSARRPLPLWAYVLIAVLLTAAITGCALSYFLPRAIPFFGIVESDRDVATYSTTRPLNLGELTVETILCVREGENGRLLMWARSDTDVSYGFSPSSPAVANVTVDGQVYRMMCIMKSKAEDGYHIVAHAEGAPLPVDTRITVTCGEHTDTLELTDISNLGYAVSEWVNFEGMTVKILPLYTNNRILTVSVEGKPNATFRLNALVYDDLGNCTPAVGGDYLANLMTCEQSLPGEIVRIEITAMHISEALPEPTVVVPLTEGIPADTVLLDTPIFKESITQVRKSGVHWGIHTERIAKSNDYTDISVSYSFKNIRNLHTYTDGNTFGYMLAQTNETEVSIAALRYSYTLRHADGSPLGIIEIDKQ